MSGRSEDHHWKDIKTFKQGRLSKFDLQKKLNNLQRNFEKLRDDHKKFKDITNRELERLKVHISALEQILFKVIDKRKEKIK